MCEEHGSGNHGQKSILAKRQSGFVPLNFYENKEEAQRLVFEGQDIWSEDMPKLKRRSLRYFISNRLAFAHRSGILKNYLGAALNCSKRPYYDDRASHKKFNVIVQVDYDSRYTDSELVADSAKDVCSKKEIFDSSEADTKTSREIYDNFKRRFSYHHLYHCGSVIQCPICASRILYVRSQEHKEIIDTMLRGRARVGKKHSYFMCTFTAQHDSNTDLKSFVKGFLDAQKDMFKDKRWGAFKQRYGIKDYISTRETTFDDPLSKHKTGAHFHVHTVFFTEAAPVTKKHGAAMERWLRKRWALALSNRGLYANEAGVKVSLPYKRGSRSHILENEEEIAKIADYLAKSVSFELSGQNEKVGKKRRRISAYQLMYFCAVNLEKYNKRVVVRRAFEELNNYFLAMKGVPWRTVSRNLYYKCGLKAKDDEKLMYGEFKTPIHEFDKKAFSNIASRGAQADLINILQVSQRVVDTGRRDTDDGRVTRFVVEYLSPSSVYHFIKHNHNLWTGERIQKPFIEPVYTVENPVTKIDDDTCEIYTLEDLSLNSKHVIYNKELASNPVVLRQGLKGKSEPTRSDDDNEPGAREFYIKTLHETKEKLSFLEEEALPPLHSVLTKLKTDYSASLFTSPRDGALLIEFSSVLTEEKQEEALSFARANLRALKRDLELCFTPGSVRVATLKDIETRELFERWLEKYDSYNTVDDDDDDEIDIYAKIGTFNKFLADNEMPFYEEPASYEPNEPLEETSKKVEVITDTDDEDNEHLIARSDKEELYQLTDSKNGGTYLYITW